MPAAHYNILRDLGATRAWRMTYRQGRALPPVDLTGCGAALTLSDRVGGLDVALTSGNGGVNLGGVDGTIEVLLSHPAYQALTAGEYTYALRITYANGEADYLLRGTWSIR